MSTMEYRVIVPPGCDVPNAIPLFQTSGNVSTLLLVSDESAEWNESQFDKGLVAGCFKHLSKSSKDECNGPTKRLRGVIHPNETSETNTRRYTFPFPDRERNYDGTMHVTTESTARPVRYAPCSPSNAFFTYLGALHPVDFAIQEPNAIRNVSSSLNLTFDCKWPEMVESLKKYKEKYGNCNVPSNFKGNTQLSSWVSHVREQYQLLANSKPSFMTKQRIATLDAVGFVWEELDTFDKKWAARLEELRLYKEGHGNCLVPRHYAKNPRLGAWVMNQRTQHSLLRDGKRSSMTTKRFLALQRLGFVWSKDDWGDWEAKFSELEKYKEKHGDCLVPSKFPPNQQLANWVINQRRFYRMLEQGKGSVITKERIKMLDDIDFVWYVRSRKTRQSGPIMDSSK